ncbi:hypothetical protein I4U23_005270 [Adineta vaga]|nr:hypothetical protein I4U23_005270 [Adineta vaga]
MHEWFISKNKFLTKSTIGLIHIFSIQLANLVIDLQISSINHIKTLKSMFNIVEAYKSDHLDIPRIIANILFAHGDIWSSNILINENDSTLSILDWEWSGV